MLRKSPQRQDWHGRIDRPHRFANQVGRRYRIARGVGRELDVKENVALETAGKRQVERAAWIPIEQVLPGIGNNSDNLDLLLRFAGSSAVHADPGSRRRLFDPGRAIGRKLNMLAERIAIGPELFRQHFVDHRHLATLPCIASAALKARPRSKRRPTVAK